MKEPKKSPVGYAALAFAVIVLLGLIALICLSTVEASAKETGPDFRSICEPDGEWWNGGHLFIVKKGPRRKRLSLELNPDKSVRYVYNTSACFRYQRYCTKEHRYQEEQSNGRWKSVGMQFWPDYIDWQR